MKEYFNGVSTIIEYRINIAELAASFSMLATSSATSYVAINLNAGTTYQFKIEARNQHGFSSYSEILTILCGSNPWPP